MEDCTQGTSVTWREYVDTRFVAIDEKIKALISDIARTAEALHEKLKEMNQLRDQVNSERGNFATKDMVSLLEKSLRESNTAQAKSYDDKIALLLQTVNGNITPIQNKQFFNSGAMWLLLIIVGILEVIAPYLVRK